MSLNFKGFRKLMKEKGSGKKEHYKDKKLKGMPVSEIKAKVRDSDLMHYITQMDIAGHVNVHDIRAPYIFSTYTSIKNNLNDDDIIKKTPWAKYIDWAKYRSEIRVWMKTNFNKGVNDMCLEYYEKKTPYSLSPFSSRALVNSYMGYGFNPGSWDTENLKKWTAHGNEMMKQIKWTDLNLMDVGDQYKDIENAKEGWNELVLANPMFGILRHDATSGWPDYHKQTIEYVLRTYWDAIHTMPDGMVTMYHRRHGYTLTINKGVPTVEIRLRFVGGVEYVVKIHGLYITWSFKMSKPDWTMYYRNWTPEYKLMTEFLEGFDGFVVTLDAAKHDQHHDSGLMYRLKDIVMKDMPDHIKKSHQIEFDGAFNNPKVLISPFHYMQSGRVMATSGSPSIPLYESITTDANITVGIEEQGGEIRFKRIQIDDSLHAIHKKIDLDKLSIFLGAKFGADISPGKTERIDLTDTSSEDKFIMFLQVIVGDLYKNPDDQIFMIDTTTDKFYYIGHPPRRDHREEMRERIRQQAFGDILWRPSEIDMPLDRLTNVQRILGTLCSIGPQVPQDLFDLKIKWLSSYKGRPLKYNPIWNDVIEYVKSTPQYDLGDYGFDPGFGIKRLNEIY